MINLLPRTNQREIGAAHSNTLLLRYLVLLIGALGFLLLALGITYISLSTSGRQADNARQQNEQAALGYSQTQTAATALRTELSAAKALFDSEIRYSKVLLRFSSLLPPGTSIQSLSVNSSSFSQPTTLSVNVAGEQQARQLQDSFSNSPYITNSSMQRINTNTHGPGYIVELSFTFDRSIAQ